MKLRLSKKNQVLVIILLVLVLGGTGGYLLWRVNQKETLRETFTEAGCTYTKVAGSDRDTECAHSTATGMACNCGENERGYEKNGNLWCAQYTSTCTSDCGDGACSSDETVASCPKDCAKCGDNICSSTESLTSCPEDCSVCGDGKCTGSETATTCASDCACKALVWGNKPSGSYTPTTVPSTVTITNPNSTTSVTTGIVVKLNENTIGSCTSSGGGTASGVRCYTASVSSGQQALTFGLLGTNSSTPSMDIGSYTLSVSVPGAKDSCTESTSFTVVEEEEEEIVVIDGEVPATGLFDGVMGKIYLGTGFVFLGVVTTQFPKFGYLFNTIGERNRVVLEEKKRKREEDKRNRFEKRFK